MGSHLFTGSEHHSRPVHLHFFLELECAFCNQPQPDLDRSCEMVLRITSTRTPEGSIWYAHVVYTQEQQCLEGQRNDNNSYIYIFSTCIYSVVRSHGHTPERHACTGQLVAPTSP